MVCRQLHGGRHNLAPKVLVNQPRAGQFGVEAVAKHLAEAALVVVEPKRLCSRRAVGDGGLWQQKHPGRRQLNKAALMVAESTVCTALAWVVHAAHINHNIERLDHFRVARANHIGPRKSLRLLQQEAAERLVAAAGKAEVRKQAG